MLDMETDRGSGISVADGTVVMRSSGLAKGDDRESAEVLESGSLLRRLAFLVSWTTARSSAPNYRKFC